MYKLADEVRMRSSKDKAFAIVKDLDGAVKAMDSFQQISMWNGVLTATPYCNRL